MGKSLYCFNCDKDVKPLCTIQNNTYVVRQKTVHVEEQIFKCPFCGNELINDNLNESLHNIYNAYIKLISDICMYCLYVLFIYHIYDNIICVICQCIA